MTAELIDRKRLKEEVRELLSGAQVSPKAMTALYGLLLLFLNMVSAFAGDAGVLSTFVSILTGLLSIVLGAGFTLYCMAIRRNERAEYLTLFDGFSFVGKLIALTIVTYAFIWLWSMLFIIPGIIAAYRYRFALYNLYENPGISVFEALNMSKRQTFGYKSQLFMLDLSYLGWSILASVPSMLYSGLLSQELMMDTMNALDFGSIGAIAFTTGSLNTAILPVWGWVLLTGLWQLAVAIFYLPTYQCVELGYFEIAKSTSGAGEGASPNHQDTRRNGPDGLGGF